MLGKTMGKVMGKTMESLNVSVSSHFISIEWDLFLDSMRAAQTQNFMWH